MHAQDDLNLRILRMVECFCFRLTRPKYVSHSIWDVIMVIVLLLSGWFIFFLFFLTTIPSIVISLLLQPTSVAQLDARPTGDQEVAVSTPGGSATFTRGD